MQACKSSCWQLIPTSPTWMQPSAPSRSTTCAHGLKLPRAWAFLFCASPQDRRIPAFHATMASGWAAHGLTACLDDAASAGVQLLYENHVRGAVWSFNDFTQPAERFLQVIQRTEGSELGVLFDTANCLALNDDPLAVLAQVQDRVGAIHLSDIRRAGAFEPTVIGGGVAPIPQILERMVAGGFDGWISIEEASRTGEEGFRTAVDFADQAWQEAGGQPRCSHKGHREHRGD